MSRKSEFLEQYPDSEVLGSVILSIVKAIGEDAQPYLEKHGLERIEPNEWYGWDQYLNVVYDIVRHEPNVVSNLVAIGMQVVENAQLPPDVDNFEKGLHALQYVWETNTRQSSEVNWKVEVLGDGHYVCTSYSPMPPDMEYGIVYGFARRFSDGHQFTVEYEDLDQRDFEQAGPVRFHVELN